MLSSQFQTQSKDRERQLQLALSVIYSNPRRDSPIFRLFCLFFHSSLLAAAQCIRLIVLAVPSCISSPLPDRLNLPSKVSQLISDVRVLVILASMPLILLTSVTSNYPTQAVGLIGWAGWDGAARDIDKSRCQSSGPSPPIGMPLGCGMPACGLRCDEAVVRMTSVSYSNSSSQSQSQSTISSWGSES